MDAVPNSEKNKSWQIVQLLFQRELLRGFQQKPDATDDTTVHKNLIGMNSGKEVEQWYSSNLLGVSINSAQSDVLEMDPARLKKGLDAFQNDKKPKFLFPPVEAENDAFDIRYKVPQMAVLHVINTATPGDTDQQKQEWNQVKKFVLKLDLADGETDNWNFAVRQLVGDKFADDVFTDLRVSLLDRGQFNVDVDNLIRLFRSSTQIKLQNPTPQERDAFQKIALPLTRAVPNLQKMKGQLSNDSTDDSVLRQTLDEALDTTRRSFRDFSKTLQIAIQTNRRTNPRLTAALQETSKSLQSMIRQIGTLKKQTTTE